MSARLVLAPSTNSADFHEVAIGRNWFPHIVVDADETTPYTEVWTDGGQSTSAHYIEDDRLGVAYVDVRGDEAEAWSEAIRSELDVLTPSEVVAWAVGVENAPERLRATGYLAAVAEQVPRDVVEDVLRVLLHDPSTDVRGGALYVCAYLAWPQLRPLVWMTSRNDPSPALRADAGTVLANLSDPD